MSVSLSVDGPGDAELISAVRGGDVDAYGELFARHVDSARRLARQLAGPGDADDLVSDAFTKVLTVLQRGGGPDLAFRAYLLTAVRRLHVDRIRAGSRLRPVDDLAPFDPGLPFHDTAVEGFDNAAAARAFASLPERWQMVLWHTEVEQQKPADIAPLLGMSANSVSALAYRAREGLRQAFLSQHATDPDDVDCAWTRDHLGAYVRGGLSRRDAARVDDHLAACRACAAVYLELTEVNSGLAGILAPLLLGSAGAGYASSGGAGSGFLSTGFNAVRTLTASHASATAIGGLLVTATAVLSIYGATHLHSRDAADVGSPPVLSPTPAASSLPTTGSDGHGKPDQPGGRSHNPDSGKSVLPPPTSEAPSVTTTSAPSSTDTSPPPASTSTDQSTEPGEPTSQPTDPSTGPTGPTGPGDGITFTSTPPTSPKFGDTYRIIATSDSGKDVAFSVDGSTPSDACSLDQAGTTVTFDHAGTCVITADVTSKTLARAAQGNTQSIVIPQADQAITFHPPSDPAVDGTATLAATSDSGLRVSYSLDSTNGACRLDGSTVRYDHALDCTITATQDGNRDYHSAPAVTRILQIGRAAQTITFTSAPDSPAVDGPGYSVSATGGPTGNVIHFSQGTPGVCTVTGSTVTFQHARTCSVVATQSGNADYQDATATQTFDVAKGLQQITFTSTPVDPKVAGASYSVSATGGPSGSQVDFAPGTPDVCTVTGSTVTFQHARTCSVVATQDGNSDYQDATATQTFEVGRGVQEITFDPTGTSFRVGDSVSASATSGEAVQLSSSNPDVCAVSSSAPRVSFVNPGSCRITATQKGNEDYEAAPTRVLDVDVAARDIDLGVTAEKTAHAGPRSGVTATVTGLPDGAKATLTASADGHLAFHPDHADADATKLCKRTPDGPKHQSTTWTCAVVPGHTSFRFVVDTHRGRDVAFVVTPTDSHPENNTATVHWD